jgi:hypothetical protein
MEKAGGIGGMKEVSRFKFKVWETGAFLILDLRFFDCRK